MVNWLKWLLIRKGSKIVTINDHIDDVQTVRQKLKVYRGVTTEEWNGKIVYKMHHIRFVTKEEIKKGKRLKST